MYIGILPASSVLIGYYHGLLLRDTNADSLIGRLCYNGLLSTHEQNVILSGHSLHCRNWLLLEHVRHMDPSSLMIFSELLKEVRPQIGIQLVTGMYVCMYVCMYVRMYVCMYVCMYACMYIYMYHMWCSYTASCIHTTIVWSGSLCSINIL